MPSINPIQAFRLAYIPHMLVAHRRCNYNPTHSTLCSLYSSIPNTRLEAIMLQTFPIFLFCTSQNFSYYSFHHPYYSPEYFSFRASQFTDKSHKTHYQHTYNTVEHTQGGTLSLFRIEVPKLQLGAPLLEIKSRLVLLVVLDCHRPTCSKLKHVT